jgi:hypothetical protein
MTMGGRGGGTNPQLTADILCHWILTFLFDCEGVRTLRSAENTKTQ